MHRNPLKMTYTFAPAINVIIMWTKVTLFSYYAQTGFTILAFNQQMKSKYMQHLAYLDIHHSANIKYRN